MSVGPVAKGGVAGESRPGEGSDHIRLAMEALERRGRARWWRRRAGKRGRIRYLDPDGKQVTDEASLERIRALAIPPGWLEARVNPKPGGRVQAVGVDTSGRLQYRYHPRFVAKRQAQKYDRLLHFGERLPLLRERANRDLCLDGFGRERVLAAVVRLVNDLYIRLGSERSEKRHKTYGATTLRNRHVRIVPPCALEIDFVGKHRVRHRRVLVDEELCALLSGLKSIGGTRLFNYVDETGGARPLRAVDVNRYIKETMGAEFSAKDFRTWHGTLLAAEALAALGPPANNSQAKKGLVAAVKKVAEQLGNTPAVCRGSYIHPVVLERYRQGVTLEAFKRHARRVVRMRQTGHEPEEAALLNLLRGKDTSGSE